MVSFFRPIEEVKQTYSKGYVEDRGLEEVGKRCAEMVVLNLSEVLIFLLKTKRTEKHMI